MADKTLDITKAEEAAAVGAVIVGNGDMFQLLCKASNKGEGWMKSAKAMEIPGWGCVLQVSTQQGDNVAEALVPLPGVRVADDVNGGRKLVACE